MDSVNKYDGFEFQYIKSKSGKELMFGELSEYVANAISENDYQETAKHYVVQCPYCKSAYLHDKSYEGPYIKRKLYVLKDFSTGFCFRCDRAFVDVNDSVRINVDIPEPPISMRDFNLVKLPSADTGDTPWTLDLFDSFSEFNEAGFNYLVKERHSYFRKLAEPLGIRYMNSNPVIPFYFKGELIYYQVKLAFGSHKMKYFSPPISHKPPYIIEHGLNKNFLICEGTFDAIAALIMAPGYTPFAVLGSTITDYQLTMLRTYVPNKVLVYMDETNLSINVANRIRSVINYADVDIVRSNGQDPEEKLKYLMSEELDVKCIK